MEFKVISEKGFNFAGKHLQKGDTLTGERYQGHISAGIHFKQIEPASEPASEGKEEDDKKPSEPKPASEGAPRKAGK